ncbi:hypothetical protein I2494_15975 [Budviciaceae bacterium BWR-B9]|uniref:N-acetyltransferase n=1 Tax=Limnobaculum allomyrinae TaxID=2791986 RepID=A0ABS1ITW3_9GAMM|nr:MULTISPECIES: hypothetical protein [Limnobaculum]MBK5145185.1 hypothetical protein [Limnobaculum allomyrinae]MBV7693017.1 hypothetical protein [Limnobaculum sp. M2-1]
MINASEWLPHQSLSDAFLSLPQAIYRHDPLWPGENQPSIEQQFSQQNPWFEQGKAWIGTIPGKARLAGFLPSHLVEGQKVAFFGFWESINDLSCNQHLFNALAGWAKQYGITQLYGPINFSTFGQYRIRLNQFDKGAFSGEPYNPPYYGTLLEQLGFSIKHRYISTFDDASTAANNWSQHYRRIKRLPMPNIEIHPLTPALWMREQRRLFEFVDRLFSHGFAYTPLKWDEFQQRCGEPFIQRFCPHSSMLAQTASGDIAGLTIALPVYRDGKAEANLCKTVAIHPRFRRSGVLGHLCNQFFQYTRQHYPRIGGAMMRDDNTSLLMSRSMLSGVNQSHHHYALYSKELS